MKAILVTGSKGQLGNEIRLLSTTLPEYQFFFTDIDELDICDKKKVQNFITSNKIDIILNCAAYTNVDKAESDLEQAMRINGDGPGILGKASFQAKIPILHISTDYVFDGKSLVPYDELHDVNPQSMYGKSKLAGEMAIAGSGAKSIIIRTSWLYSSFGNNFVKTMIRLGNERDSIGVVSDQTGTPTYAQDLAQVMLTITKTYLMNNSFISGIFHYSNAGCCSWYDFAVTIMELSNLKCKVNAIRTEDYPLPAKRPQYSVFNKNKIIRDYGILIPHWKDSLNKCLSLLCT